MVKLNKIYTCTGDDGTTGLCDGSRVRKYADRVHVMGHVDEANAAIGALSIHCHEPMLKTIQNDLFDLGADIATPYTTDDKALRVTAEQVGRLEHEMDVMSAEQKPLTSFILPGGTQAAAEAHLARTVVRRAERWAWQLADEEDINEHALRYLNRLSDYLFVLSRKLNNNGEGDVLWVPGENR